MHQIGDPMAKNLVSWLLSKLEVIDKEIMFQLLLVGEELGMRDKAQSVFRSLLYTGAWSCKIGEIPDSLSHRKTPSNSHPPLLQKLFMLSQMILNSFFCGAQALLQKGLNLTWPASLDESV